MVAVRFSNHLKRFIELPQQFESNAFNVRELLNQLEKEFPGIASYLLHENGKLRQHVNIFLDNAMIRDRNELTDLLDNVDEVVIMQALSGG